MRTGRSIATKPKKSVPPVSDKTKLEQSSILDYRSVQSGGSAIQNKRKQTGVRSTRQSDGVTPLPPPMVSVSVNASRRAISSIIVELVISTGTLYNIVTDRINGAGTGSYGKRR